MFYQYFVKPLIDKAGKKNSINYAKNDPIEMPLQIGATAIT